MTPRCRVLLANGVVTAFRHAVTPYLRTHEACLTSEEVAMGDGEVLSTGMAIRVNLSIQYGLVVAA